MASYDASGVIRLDFGSAGEARNSFLYGNGVPAVATFGVRASALKLREHIGQGVIQFGFSANGYADNSTRKTTLTAKDVVGDVLRQWGMCCDNADSLDACIKGEALQAVNAAIQFIHANGKQLPYLTRRTRAYFFSAATPYVEMESDVQHIEGHGRTVAAKYLSIDYNYGAPSMSYPGTPFTTPWFMVHPTPETDFYEYSDFANTEELAALIQSKINNGVVCYADDKDIGFDRRNLSIYFDDTPKVLMDSTGYQFIYSWEIPGDFVTYSGLLLTQDVTSKSVTPLESRFDYENYVALYGTDAPPAYWLERLNTGDADSSKVVLHFVPVATDPTCLRIDVGVQAGRVEWNDVVAGTTIPIPHEYVESLLIPIARWYATSSKNYRQRERHEAIIEQYNQALAMLGMVDPKPAGQPAKDGDAK